MYTSSAKFKSQIAIYTEIVSNGKLKLIKDKRLKSQLLKLYNNSYPDLEFFQKNTSETIRNISTNDVNNIRWLLAVNNDDFEDSSIQLKNPLVQLNDDWLKNKQSDGFRIFENLLTLRYANYSGAIKRYKGAINEIELLESEISTVLKKK